MSVPVRLEYDPSTDMLLIRVAAADGAAEVTLLSMGCRTLSTTEKQQLSHIRDPKQVQR
jgi:hypothetical protein